MNSSVRHGWILGAALVMTFAAVFMQSLAAPGRALACSCVMPMPTIADMATEPGTVVVAGSIGPQQPERTPVEVDTWFHGGAPAPVIWLSFGSQMTTSCDPSVNVGERRLLVLSRVDEQLYSYNPCVQAGVIGTPDGDAALAAAEQLFGGQLMPTPEPTEPPNIGETPGLDAARLYVVGAIGAAVLLLAGVVLFAMLRRRRTDE